MWKITDIQAKDNVITSAKYFVFLEDKENKVETEGYWYFSISENLIPFEKITEEIVIEWIKKESNGKIEDRLKQQLDDLKLQKVTIAPWMPQIFKPEL